MKSTSHYLFLFCLMASGIACGGDDVSGGPCTVASGCDSDTMCVDASCVSRLDAAPSDASSQPDAAPSDASSQPDAAGPIGAESGGSPALSWFANTGLHHGGTLVVSTDGTNDFGTKTQAAATLWDYGQTIYENGIFNSHHQGQPDGFRINRPNVDPDSIWGKASVESAPTDRQYLGTTRLRNQFDMRHPRITARYYMDRSADLTTPKMTNVFIGWPVANGGTDTTGKPHKIYVRWWAKEYFPMAEWRSIAYSSIVGTPIGGEVDAQGVYQLGELVRIESGTNTDYIYGILSSATSGRVELTTGYMFEMPPPFSDHRYASIQAAELSNAVIRGMTSGAVIQLPNIADQVGPSSSKILRMWDNVDGRNWRTSWSTNSTIIGGSNLQSNLDYPFYTTAPRYRLHEFYVDAVDSSNVTSQSFVDGISGMSSDPFTGSQTVHYDAARGFSIALLGVDSNVDTDRTNGSFCEIYQDSTPQRVVFAAESTWAARTSDEIQRTTEWSPTSITVEINQGAFESLHGKYMYVVDSNNQPINTTGILL